MLGLTLHLRKVRRTGRVSIWLMAVNTRGERNERLARAAAARRKVSGHLVDLQRDKREAQLEKELEMLPMHIARAKGRQ